MEAGAGSPLPDAGVGGEAGEDTTGLESIGDGGFADGGDSDGCEGEAPGVVLPPVGSAAAHVMPRKGSGTHGAGAALDGDSVTGPGLTLVPVSGVAAGAAVVESVSGAGVPLPPSVPASGDGVPVPPSSGVGAGAVGGLAATFLLLQPFKQVCIKEKGNKNRNRIVGHGESNNTNKAAASCRKHCLPAPNSDYSSSTIFCISPASVLLAKNCKSYGSSSEEPCTYTCMPSRHQPKKTPTTDSSSPILWN